MNGTQIFEMSLDKSHTSPENVLISKADRYMNIVFQELVDEIVNVSKGDWYWDTGKTDSVTGQSEYTADKLGIAPDDLDIKKINKVFVKYKSTAEYPTRLKYQNPGTLERHPDYYKDNQTEVEPFFYIQDKSIFIYPAPTEVITGGVELFVIHKPYAINTSSAENEIELPVQFHYLISLGMAYHILQGQRKYNEAEYIQGEYTQGIAKMVAFVKERYNQPKPKTLSNLNEFR